MTTPIVPCLPANGSSPSQSVPVHAYRPDIDGLRAFAVIFVIIFHAFPEVLRGGFVGVDVFFVISGFLIGGIILRDLGNGKFSFLHFYERRILRIFPALAIVLGAVLLAGYFLLFNDEYEMLGKHVFGGAAFVSNLMYYFEAGYWDVSGKYKPLLHLWSLGIEEQFYVIIPIVLAVAWKRKYRLSAVIAVLLIASFACNLSYYRSRQELDFYMPFTRFWEIFIGVMLAASVGRVRPPQGKSFRAKAFWDVVAKDDWRYARCVLSILGVICLVVAALASRNRHFPGHRALWPTFGALCIIAAGGNTWLNRKVFSNKFAVAIGLISYPLYLWHWPLLSFAAILGGEDAGSLRWTGVRLACIAVSFVFAFLTYAFIERPVRFGKACRKLKVFVLLVLVTCFGGIGLCISSLGAPKERSLIGPYQEELDAMRKMGALIAADRKDDSILTYIPGAVDWEFGRYHDAGGKRTVAVIGDSHAPPVFQGISEWGGASGFNSVLLGCRVDRSERSETSLALAAIKSKEDISDIFVALRGVYYFSGVDIDSPEGWNDYRNGFFKQFLQYITDELRGAGKRVYIVTENPVYPYFSRTLISRPLGMREWALFNVAMPRDEVYRHQEACLDMLSEIRGAEIINGLEPFCRDTECSMLSEDGIPLYHDDDHLSVYGGRYLAEKLLEPYLSAIAEREEENPGTP